MSSNLDLSAHAGEIASTHKRILSNDPDISWALYGFDRGGSALNVQAQGGAGLEELADEFNDGKVQFAFARVKDPNTGLPKFVFISWCGQGVPVFRKGLVGSQVGEVQRVLDGYHVAVVARSEEDVRPEEIIAQVGRSSGAQYSYHTQPKRQPPPVTAAKPVFGAGTAFRKGGSYGAPTVSKGPAWEAAAAAATSPPMSAARSGYAQSPPVSASSAIGGNKPLFGAGATGSHPASSLHRARSPTYGAGAPHQPAYSPGPASPMHEPERADPARVPAYRSQQEERQSELEALRRSSRAHSSASADRGAVLTHPSSPSSSRIGFQAPGEPSAKVSQADQTKGELEMLRSRRLLNSGLDASTVAAEKTAASERKAELDALRRARSGSQNAFNAAPVSPPVHSWNQGQGQDQQRQQDEDERRRRESEQRQREEDERRRQENEQRQREEDERRRWDQERQREDAERKRDQERERQAEMERQRVASAAAPQKELLSREPRARALYDYDQQTEDELGFKEGDIIYNVDQLDPGWWAGESEDGLRQGMFPSNFVEMLAQQDLGANHAIALFEYEATEDGELSFNEGDQIAHIELVSSDWWEGVNTTTGMQGLFPANHVELQ